MPTNTYVALDKVTVSGSSTTSITFNSINQGYTHLLIVVNAASSSAASCRIRFNGDTSTNYSDTRLYGDGSSVTSDRLTNRDHINCGDLSVTSINSNQIINVMNYSNATTHKTVLTRSNIASGYVFANVSLWRATPAAITSITVFPASGNFIAGSTFSLYGIAAEGVSPAPKATGGAIYSDDTYYYHAFAASGTFTPTQSLTADILVVAGGGGGGARSGLYGGGGGAGGLLQFTSQSLASGTGYTCTVGSGGAGVSGTSGNGTQGGNSQFGALTACVGGGYGSGTATSGGNGGSGGGGSRSYSGGTATSGQGYNGGTSGSVATGSGGGGAGGAGTGTTNDVGGVGGIGATSSLINAINAATGAGQLVSSTAYFAGGGGGCGAQNINVAGGYGGGGYGAGWSAISTAGSGTVNTGGGGGGSVGTYVSGSGGSGIVIVRYAKA